MADFLLEMPKAELHLHLEGSVEPETLYELAPSTPLAELRALYCYADFEDFLKAFGAVGKRLRTPEDYALVARRLEHLPFDLAPVARVVAVLQTKLAQAEPPARPQFLDECSEHRIAGGVLYKVYNTPPATSPPPEPSRKRIPA